MEWPDKGKGVLNPADVVLSMTAEKGEQRVRGWREVLQAREYSINLPGWLNFGAIS